MDTSLSPEEQAIAERITELRKQLGSDFSKSVTGPHDVIP